MQRHSESVSHTGNIASIVITIFLIGILSLLVGAQNYLLFHSLSELFAVIISMTIFIVAWNTRHIVKNHYLLLLGTAYLVVGVYDLTHMLAYHGMGVLPGFSTDTATQLWIVARYVEALSLLIAPYFLRRQLRGAILLSTYILVGLFLYASILLWDIFPVCYRADTGLTAFKIISEYVICGLLIGAIVYHVKRRALLDRWLLYLMVSSLGITVASELSFTLYNDPYAFANMVGHLLKIASFYLVYRAMVHISLAKPYEHLFRELKSSESMLRRERDRTRMYFDSAGTMLLVINTRGIIMNINRAGCDILAANYGNIIGLNWFDRFIPARERELRRKIFERDVSGTFDGDRRVKQSTSTIITADGNERIISWQTRVLLDADGNITGMLESGNDVTESRLMHERLREQEALFRTAVDSYPSIFVIYDRDGKIEFMNARGLAIYGKTEAQVLGFSESDLFPDETTREYLPMLQRVLDSGVQQSGEVTLRFPGGTFVLINTYVPLHNEHGHVYRVLGISHDITERKQAEQNLRRIEWLLTKNLTPSEDRLQNYHFRESNPGDKSRIIPAVGRDMLLDIMGEFLDLLDTSASVYELDGAYSLGIFASQWCRELAEIPNDDSGAAMTVSCDEPCWLQMSEKAIKVAGPVDMKCSRGISMYSVPIMVRDIVVGAMSIGYGDPPDTDDELERISRETGIALEVLRRNSDEYESRPAFITEIAKSRLITSAHLIGTIIERRETEHELNKAREELEHRVRERTLELAESNQELHREIGERRKIEQALLHQTQMLEAMLNHQKLLANVAARLNSAVLLSRDIDSLLKLIATDLDVATICIWSIQQQVESETRGAYLSGTCYSSNEDHDKRADSILDWLKGHTFPQSTIIEYAESDEGLQGFFREYGIHESSIFPVMFDRELRGYIGFFRRESIVWRPEEHELMQTITDMIANDWKRHFSIRARIEAEKKQTEAVQMAERASRLASIGVVAGGITHEINQPLTAIKVNVDSILYWDKLNKGAVPRKFISKLSRISSSVDRINEIILHMRRFWYGPERVENERFNMNDVIQSALSLVHRQLANHRIETVLDLDNSELLLYGSPIQLEQVMVNLMVNAKNALDRVQQDEKNIHITTSHDNDVVAVTVRDNGPGLPPGSGENLFDPFYSTGKSDQGMGLGLAIVKRIVDEHYGTIRARNHADGGAEFVIEIPVGKERIELDDVIRKT